MSLGQFSELVFLLSEPLLACGLFGSLLVPLGCSNILDNNESFFFLDNDLSLVESVLLTGDHCGNSLLLEDLRLNS